ncbi:threonine/serine exporter family protein [Fodinicola feengrottensis]|uniref:Threonine/serine exporter family protein n=2 Tax=Fodinicola feengrottensis TaxID=435914 RepID=A0ABN2HZW8_9ACTN
METLVERTRRSNARTAWGRLLDRAAARRLDNLIDLAEEEPGAPETYRAMDLALRVGELLLASGESTESVTEAMVSLAQSYELPRSEAIVNFTAISISCLPGRGAAPVTGERLVRRRSPDYTKLVAVHTLIRTAATGTLSLDDAFAQLNHIKYGRGGYQRWLIALSLPLMSAAAAMLSGGGLLVSSIAFLAALLADQTTVLLARRGIAEFYQFAVAGAIGSLTAVLLMATGLPLHGSTVVTASIITLLPGRALVASVTDGITGAYVSAGARMLEVFFALAAIVSGVGLVVYTAVHCGLPLSIAGLPATPPGLNALQIGAAVVLTVTFALSMHTPPRELLAAAIGGGLIWVLYTLLREAAFSPIIAAGVSAAAIGTIAHFAASWARRPALPYVVPLIGPLLPGTALYRGLLELGGGNVSQGLLHLTQALAIGMALAAGICVGGELVRAFRGTPIAAVASNWRRPAARRTRGY